MKVWEWMRDVKGTEATEEQIISWFYMNRIEPCDLIVRDCDDPIYNARNELGLKDELPGNLLKLVKGKYYHPIDYGKWQDTIKAFLEEEI